MHDGSVLGVNRAIVPQQQLHCDHFRQSDPNKEDDWSEAEPKIEENEAHLVETAS